MQSNEFVLAHPVSLCILGVLNLALAVLGIVIVVGPRAKLGAFEFMAIAINLLCGAFCFYAAYNRWRKHACLGNSVHR